MDKSLEFKNYRNNYKNFVFQSYGITEDTEEIVLKYDFEIEGLTRFSSLY